LAVAVIAVFILAVGGIYIANRQEPEVEPVESEPSLDELQQPVEAHSLPIAAVIDGIAEDTGEPVPEYSVSNGELRLVIDIDFLDRIDATYELTIQDFGGEELWRLLIPNVYIEKGQLPVRLDTNVFSPGEYRIEIMQREADDLTTVVAESTFRLVE
jgi:hypothetical protein